MGRSQNIAQHGSKEGASRPKNFSSAALHSPGAVASSRRSFGKTPCACVRSVRAAGEETRDVSKSTQARSGFQGEGSNERAARGLFRGIDPYQMYAWEKALTEAAPKVSGGHVGRSEELRELAQHYHGEMIAEQGMDLEARVLELICDLKNAEQPLALKEIMNWLQDRHG